MTGNVTSSSSLRIGFACLVGAVLTAIGHAEEVPSKEIAIGDGKLTLEAPSTWARGEPRVRIIDHEFSIPSTAKDSEAGRLTIMSAGGTVQANIDRWIGQFTQPDGSPTGDRVHRKKETVAGRTVHLLDISGTFHDRRGPFAPAAKRDDYRMLAAIIETGDASNCFVKFYGPQKLVAANEARFHEMINSLRAK